MNLAVRRSRSGRSSARPTAFKESNLTQQRERGHDAACHLDALRLSSFAAGDQATSATSPLHPPGSLCWRGRVLMSPHESEICSTRKSTHRVSSVRKSILRVSSRTAAALTEKSSPARDGSKAGHNACFRGRARDSGVQSPNRGHPMWRFCRGPGSRSLGGGHRAGGERAAVDDSAL